MYTVVAENNTILMEKNIQAYTGYLGKLVSFGTFAGGTLFGAWVFGSRYDKASYQFIDSGGNGRIPPTSITIQVTSVVSGDRISVFRTNAGLVDKALYNSHVSNNAQGDSTFEITNLATLATDTRRNH